MFASLERLAASFAFDRTKPDRTPDKLFPTLARDMADFDGAIRRALSTEVGDNRALRATTDIEEQFTSLIVRPLQSLSIIGPFVIVIDALDECVDGSHVSRADLVHLLARRSRELPSNIRLIITSRPALVVRQLDGEFVRVMDMHAINMDSNNKDVGLYIRHRLLEDPPSTLHGIDEACCDELIASSEGLFQWAHVACDTIVSTGREGFATTARERYGRLVGSRTHTGSNQSSVLDELYMRILSRVVPMNSSTGPEQVRYRIVMGLILVSFEPVSLAFMNSLMGYIGEAFDAQTVVQYLGSLLGGVTVSLAPIEPLHTSFYEFLTDESRSDIFFVDRRAAHQGLALACLRGMQSDLHFNMLRIPSSHPLTSWSIHETPSNAISPQLGYACRFWAEHCLAAFPGAFSEELLELIDTFLSSKLLFWLEVLGVIGIHIAIPALVGLSSRLPVS